MTGHVLVGDLLQARHGAQGLAVLLIGHGVGNLYRLAGGEKCHDVLVGAERRLFGLGRVGIGEVLVEHDFDGAAADVARDRQHALLLAFVHQFDLPRDGRQRLQQVADAWHGTLAAGAQGAAFGVRDHVLQQANGQARAHAGVLVNVIAFAGLERDLFNYHAQVIEDGHVHRVAVLGRAFVPGFLARDLLGRFDLVRIMRHDLTVDAVFQRRDDIAAIRVVFGIGRKNHKQIQRQTDGKAADLQVFFLHDVQQADLDARLEVGQFVDGEDAAVRARDDPVMNDVLGRETQAQRSGLDRVDVSEQVGDGHVGRRQLFAVAVFTMDPGDGRVVAVLGDEFTREATDRPQRFVVDFAARDNRDVLVQQPREQADDAGLGLAAQPQQQDVMPRQQGVHELWNNRFFVPDDPGKQLVATPQRAHQVAADFVFDRTRLVTAGFEFAKCLGSGHGVLSLREKYITATPSRTAVIQSTAA